MRRSTSADGSCNHRSSTEQQEQRVKVEISDIWSGEVSSENNIPFTLQCVCGRTLKTLVSKVQLLKGNSFLNECSSCGKTIVLTITEHDPATSTVSYSVQVRASQEE